MTEISHQTTASWHKIGRLTPNEEIQSNRNGRCASVSAAEYRRFDVIFENQVRMRTATNFWLFSGALILPPLFSAAISQIIKTLEQPHSTHGWYFSGLIPGVIIGTACLAALPFRNKWTKYLSLAVYLPLMLWVSWIAGGISFFINWEYCC